MIGYIKKHFIKSTLILILLSISVLLILFLLLVRQLPDYKKLVDYKPPQMSRLYSADGYLIDEYAKQKRLYVPISSIPQHVIDAFLAAEDSNFYNHIGVDVKSILRALYQNIFRISQGKNVVGASTITQQVVKNILLTKERTLSRKIKEAILSINISTVISKDKILELYLNEIYLGYRSYGVAAAAINYFNKSLNQLTIAEAAFLATLPKAPTSLDPKKNYSKVLTRRNWVLYRMYHENFISEQQYTKAIVYPITLIPQTQSNTLHAGSYSEEVRKRVLKILSDKNLKTDGLFVSGTVESKLQQEAHKSLQWGLRKYDRSRGYRGPLDNLDISIYPEENIAEDDVKNIDDLVNFLEQDIETELSLRDDWPELLSKVKKPKELKWHDWKLAIILKTEAEKAIIGFEDGTKGKIPVNYLKWTRTLEKIFDEETQKYKEEKSEEVTDTNQIFKKGDVIIVKKYGNPKNNNYALRQIPDVSGAMVVMNPHNGDILALVGGYNDDKIEFNNATQALRQPGSIIKPFTYLAALEKGFMPNKILIDDEVRMKKEDGTSWIPKNYSGKFYGPTTMRIGLEKSRNVVTVRLAEIVGLGRIAEVIERLGVNTAPEKNYSMILGASESNLLKITNAYAMIANGGKKVKPNFIKKINDNNGNIIYKNNKQECLNCKLDVFADNSSITRPEINEEIERVMDEKTAYQMISLLEGVVQRGTGWRAKHLKKPIGGKTGTTNDSFDAWFVGFSSDLVIGVWVGYDKPISLGMHATGSSVTLPVFVKFLKNVISEENAKPFNIPKGIKFAKIDRLTGQKPTRNTNKEDIIFESFKEENYSKIFHTIEDNDKLSPRDDDYSPPIIF